MSDTTQQAAQAAPGIYFAVGTPTIELNVIATAPDGKTSNFKVGFKRYSAEDSIERMEYLQSLSEVLEDPIESSEELERLWFRIKDGDISEGDDEYITKTEYRQKRDELKAARREAENTFKQNLNSALREDIIYFKDLVFLEDVPGKPGEYRKGLVIPDSRTTKPDERFQGKTCLDFLLDMSLSWAPVRKALFSSLMEAVGNIKVEKNASAKN